MDQISVQVWMKSNLQNYVQANLDLAKHSTEAY